MKRVRIIPVVVAVGCMLLTQNLAAQMHASQTTLKSKKAKIQNAMSAAPKAIAKDATILDYPAKEGDQPPILRKGTNGWSCFPDDPNSPGNDPMCLDTMGMVWFQALMAKTEPKLTAPGLSYMLQGGSDANNADPFATQPPVGASWVTSPPHIMVLLSRQTRSGRLLQGELLELLTCHRSSPTPSPVPGPPRPGAARKSCP